MALVRKEYLELFRRLHSHSIVVGELAYANVHRRPKGSRKLAVCDFESEFSGHFDKSRFEHVFREEIDDLMCALNYGRSRPIDTVD